MEIGKAIVLPTKLCTISFFKFHDNKNNHPLPIVLTLSPSPTKILTPPLLHAPTSAILTSPKISSSALSLPPSFFHHPSPNISASFVAFFMHVVRAFSKPMQPIQSN
ncbi:hypothetical protein VNO77_25807 [Canavalia gladiata]|uniref:Uncharacterized protein n=1 Tax=Canavalia gladiata TaxID=3824 RepID=A0AAN9Q927_CANGL